MLIKGIKDECFGDFKEVGMLIVFPWCKGFKCDRENGNQICQNSHLANEPVIDITPQEIVERYVNNPIPKALICGGLEPLDSIHELYELICAFRKATDDPIVIYTGYTANECEHFIGFEQIKWSGNIYFKFGRFIPGHQPHYDEVLGVNLASDNQFGRYYE